MAKVRWRDARITRVALRLLSQVEERADLHSLFSKLDRKIDESAELERRGGEVNHSVFPGFDVPVLASAAVICEDNPLVLALPQVVIDKLVNQLVGEMLQDVLGYEQIRGGEFLGYVADLKLDLVSLVLLADGHDNIGGDVDPKVARIAPIDCAREAPVPAARIDDRLYSVLLDEVLNVCAILPGDLQSRSRAARSLTRGVLAPFTPSIDAVEGIGQRRLSVNGINGEVGKRQRKDQGKGNGDGLLHRFLATLPARRTSSNNRQAKRIVRLKQSKRRISV